MHTAHPGCSAAGVLGSPRVRNEPLQRSQAEKTKRAQNPWPHRLAWVVACGTFPLIWVGGLVTTYQAGMAVPDWPTTYGYNPFLYPLASWLAVWDLFLEHSHRLIGAGVGLATIALVIVTWLCEPRRWLRWMALGVLAAVVAQGTLGGLRVLEDAILLAKIHGLTAPVFFALAASLVTVSSPRWAVAVSEPSVDGRWGWKGLGATALVYGQILLGAQLRHLAVDMDPRWFQLWVWLHLINAGLLLGTTVWLASGVCRQPAAGIVRRRAKLLVLLVLGQILLGCGVWVVGYNWPAWFLDYFWAIPYTVVAEGRLQVWVTTAHVAVGALCLATGLSLSLWGFRAGRPGPRREGRKR